MIRLHVNVDHVATVRNARGTPYPDPVRAAAICLAAGAHGITAHLREDRRHIVDDDVKRLRAAVRTTFNLEMAATDEMVAIAVAARPDVVTLVPERREERTTEGGLDVVGGGKALAAGVAKLRGAKIKVSLFIAADPVQIEASAALGVEQIELHTGEFCHAALAAKGANDAGVLRELERLSKGARLAHDKKLEVAAGHGLTLENVGAVCALEHVVELNIGHAIVADALFFSLAGAVEAMARAVQQGERARGAR
jgi:pyridoxine 5-phosphate synthase